MQMPRQTGLNRAEVLACGAPQTSEGFEVAPARVMFLYWGRRGSLPRFSMELARVALSDKAISASISISRQNMSFRSFEGFGSALFPVTTFETRWGAFFNLWRLPKVIAALKARLRADGTTAVIDLMPHIWSPIIAPAIKSMGVRYVPIIHDADPHPGDRTTLVKRWIDRSIDSADLVITLSGAVAGRLEALGRINRSRVVTLFHPDLNYAPFAPPRPPRSGEPMRLLFLGRILAYKGLPLFLDAVEILREAGLSVEVGVYGEGPLGSSAARLAALNAEVVNRWLSEEEVAQILPRYHAVILSHTEASQSGVAAAALGAGIPVVATPVGGLIEQISDGRTGVVALRADGNALAEAIEDLLLNPTLYEKICENISITREERSMARFARECARIAVDTSR